MGVFVWQVWKRNGNTVQILDKFVCGWFYKSGTLRRSALERSPTPSPPEFQALKSYELFVHENGLDQLLTSDQEELWRVYQAVESRGTRGAKLEALESFVTRLEQSPIQDWEAWARDIARGHVDDNEGFPIRMPLFRRVIFPALLRGHRNQSNGCARWLAGLSQHLYQSVDCENQLPAEERTELGLIRAAIRQDPFDERSKLRLIELLADRLAHSIHEIPAGVLHGMDGATPDQCMELQNELDEFAGLVEADGQDYRFHTLIAKCRFHFQRYREYLLNLENYNSYEHYLNSVAT